MKIIKYGSTMTDSFPAASLRLVTSCYILESWLREAGPPPTARSPTKLGLGSIILF